MKFRQMPTDSGFFRLGANVWRVARASRASVLIDGAAYFASIREALLNARHCVFILGWDVHSRMRLVGECGRARDEYPAEFAPFLARLVSERPELKIHLLLWDFSLLYAGEREWLPRLRLDWATPPNIHFHLDDAVPTGASQHQKIVVIDDAVAFSGGLDLTVRRWDTPAHDLRNKLRVDPSGYRYPPFHDVQMVVDGEPAQAIAEIARERWQAVAGDHAVQVQEKCDPWPRSVVPQFENVKIGISRTRPIYGDHREVREIERQFLDAVDSAERAIYIENQFLTHYPFAERLAKALSRNPTLEVVIMTPHGAESWIEAHTMRRGRARFVRALSDSGAAGRVRILCPSIGRGEKCVYPMIHSKVMIVDDKLLRVGSANLNNRSMGTDTECDLTIEANTRQARARVEVVRNTLLAEHCKTDPATFAAALGEHRSLVTAVDYFGDCHGCLQPIDDSSVEVSEETGYLEALADPERPISYESLVKMSGMQGGRRVQLTLVVLGVSLFVVSTLALLWYFTPLADLADPSEIRTQLAAVDGLWAPLTVIAVFLLASLIAFPINILIMGTAAAFGPLMGAIYAGAGCLVSALAIFALGRWLGASVLQDVLGARLNRVRERVVERGLLAIAAIRLVPVAPFTVVNLVAGAAEVRLNDYLIGTLLGLAPGIAVMSFLGDRATEVFARPTAMNISLLVLGAVAWIGVAIAAQYLVSKIWKKQG